MTKETISVRVEENIIEDIERVQEEESLSQADAVRYLIRFGLDYEEMEERVEELESQIEKLQGQIEQQNAIIQEQQATIQECLNSRSIWDRLFS